MSFTLKNKSPQKKDLEKEEIKKKDEAQIITAYKLSEEEINLIKKKFPSLDTFQLNNIVDEKIIAGLVIRFNSKVIDLSVQGQLKKIKKLFYEIS